MNTYLLIHTHRHGITTELFQSNTNYEGFYAYLLDDDDIKPVLESLGIDFKPDREETIDIQSLDLGDIKEVK